MITLLFEKALPAAGQTPAADLAWAASAEEEVHRVDDMRLEGGPAKRRAYDRLVARRGHDEIEKGCPGTLRLAVERQFAVPMPLREQPDQKRRDPTRSFSIELGERGEADALGNDEAIDAERLLRRGESSQPFAYLDEERSRFGLIDIGVEFADQIREAAFHQPAYRRSQDLILVAIAAVDSLCGRAGGTHDPVHRGLGIALIQENGHRRIEKPVGQSLGFFGWQSTGTSPLRSGHYFLIHSKFLTTGVAGLARSHSTKV